MKRKITNILISGVCLFLAFIGIASLFTGSKSSASANTDHIPGVAVVDKKGVGQTQKEISSGMNGQAIYDYSTNTLLWNIGKEYELVEDYTYYITFKVEKGQIKGEECRLLKE